MTDNATACVPARWISGERHDPRQPGNDARLATQFVEQNRGLLRDFGVMADVRYDGTRVDVQLVSSSTIGAAPLLSPTTGRPDFGLVVSPRFDWSGIGPVLGATGWRVVPEPLPLPLLPRSAREVPAWVLAAAVLHRIDALLSQLDRRFSMQMVDEMAPRGTVDWGQYARTRVPRANLLRVPCRVPTLEADRQIRAAAHYALRKQLRALESQRAAGVVVLRLIDFCQSLIRTVATTPPQAPAGQVLAGWRTPPLRREVFREGLQAISWTVDDRGLGGLSDLHGLAWAMPMESFFEAWVETVLVQVSRLLGGSLALGRKDQTVVPLAWQPPYTGSQRSLRPDFVLSREHKTVIVDAKYKRHWEELSLGGWGSLEEQVREHHRADLLQVLAYGSLPATREVTVVLAYPCTAATWASLTARGRTAHVAEVPAGARRVRLALTGIPMQVELLPEAARELATLLA